MRPNPGFDYRQLLSAEQEDDPMEGMTNLFDLAMVFAVALMVALVSYMKLPEFFSDKDVTLVKNAGKPDMEIIVKKDKKITRYKSSETSGSGKGTRIGVAYQLENGEIIYVPE